VKGIAADLKSGAAPRDNREAILVAVSRVIARRGIRGLRIEDVAREAGVSAPLLYYHFGSRAGLVKAALEHASEQAPSTALRRPSDQDGYDAVASALEAELGDEPTVRDNAVVWGEATASAIFERDLRPDVKHVTAAWCATVAEAIREGVDDGSIRPDVVPEEAAEMLITLVDGLCQRWLAGTISRDRARELLRRALTQTLAVSG
jgi:AcrR family transcriptional regulator